VNPTQKACNLDRQKKLTGKHKKPLALHFKEYSMVINTTFSSDREKLGEMDAFCKSDSYSSVWELKV